MTASVVVLLVQEVNAEALRGVGRVVARLEPAVAGERQLGRERPHTADDLPGVARLTSDPAERVDVLRQRVGDRRHAVFLRPAHR